LSTVLVTPSLTREAATATLPLLPVPAVEVRERDAGRPAPDGEAHVATFVGACSADVAIALTAPIPTDGAVTTGDVLRPALEAATAALGAGLLGDVTPSDASSLLSAPDTVIYDLLGPGQEVVGWFAVRVRDTGPRRSATSAAPRLSRISDVEMTLTVEIGRTRMSVRDVLDLEPGGVIELDRSAGAPADLLLNGRLIAHGEVVVVDQDYAIRVTRILDAGGSEDDA